MPHQSHQSGRRQRRPTAICEVLSCPFCILRLSDGIIVEFLLLQRICRDWFENHNTEFKPSRKAWSRTREHKEVEQDLAKPLLELVPNVQRTEGGPATNGQLISVAGACDTSTYVDGTYDLIITTSGHIYIDSMMGPWLLSHCV